MIKGSEVTGGAKNRPRMPSDNSGNTIDRMLKDDTPRTPMSSLYTNTKAPLPPEFYLRAGETEQIYVDRAREALVKQTPGADNTYETLR